MIDNYIAVLKKYADFKSRATRKEYWLFYITNIIIILAGYLLVTAMGGFRNGALPLPVVLIGVALVAYSLIIIIPQVSVTVRRLHDTSRSGWWFLIAFVPYIGGFILLFFMILESTPGDNLYGPNPKASQS